MSQVKFILNALLLVFISSIARSANPVVHISPKPTWLNTYKPYDKLVPLRSVENGFFYQLIEEQEHVEKKADYSHIIRHIVSATGIQNGSEISVGFDPSFQRLDFHEITVWRDGKPQNRLNASSFKVIADEKELSRFIYQGSFSAYCILSDIRKGDKIEYAYTITGRNPILGNKFCRDVYMQQSQPVAHIYKSIITSTSRKLNFKSFNKPPKMVQTTKAGFNCYAWEDFQVRAGVDYTNQPGWSTSYNYIQVSDFANWNEVAQWALAINPVATTFMGNLAKQIAKLKFEAGKDKEKYFRLAVKLVQDEVRYMGIEMGEYSHRANRPEKVFDQRYGDCKDKSLLLASILNAGGIPANLVLINTYAEDKTDIYLPSAYDFDHVTVVATVNSKTVWVDATMSNQGGKGLDIYYPQYKKGLILTPGTTDLSVIPPSKTGKVDCKESFTVEKDSNQVTLEVITKYTLDAADRQRNRLASTSRAEMEQNYLNYYQKLYPKMEATDSVSVFDEEEINEITTIERYAITDFFSTDTATGKKTASFYGDYINEQLADVNAKMKYPRTLNYPCNINFTTSVTMPDGWNVKNTDFEINRDAYYFKSTASVDGFTLNLNYQFKHLQNYLPVEKLDQYAADVKKIKEELGYSFSYTPGAETVSSYKINYWMVLAVMVLAILAGITGLVIYRRHTPEVVFEPGANFMPLGGWPILVSVGLSATALMQFVGIANGTYFDLDLWNVHIPNINATAYKAILMFEALGNTLLMCYALFCLVLLLNRRDILPRFIIGFYLFAVIFFMLDYVFAVMAFNKASNQAVMLIVRSVVVSAIWIPYFIKSERVARTFIVPQPSTNYRYEQHTLKEEEASGA